jgi:hypothetical protein
MSDIKKSVSVAAIGRDLMAHAKAFAVDGNKRGLVVELFPSIVAASERMSARAISRFLEEKHGIKISVVTISKALNDPKKYWNQFFDLLEPSIVAYEKWENAKREDFLFDDERFKPVNFPGREVLRKQLLKFEFAQAINVLRDKWFAIDHETRMKARPHLAERLLGKAK